MHRLGERASPAYLKTQQQLHSSPRGYGGKGGKWANTVIALIDAFDAGSVLDYGCGKGQLVRDLRDKKVSIRLSEYDPAITGKDAEPLFADLVTITDVLEHVEPEYLNNVLEHVRALARRAVFFVVALDPANKILSDGRNAHLILKPREWWHGRVSAAGFTVQDWRDEWPLPFQYDAHPEKQRKRWIAVGVPE